MILSARGDDMGDMKGGRTMVVRTGRLRTAMLGRSGGKNGGELVRP
jgi:hypothetical protein